MQVHVLAAPQANLPAFIERLVSDAYARGVAETEARLLPKPVAPEDLPLYKLGLLPFIKSRLACMGVMTIKQLLATSDEQLQSIPGVGWRRLYEIDDKLARMGLKRYCKL